MHKFKMDCSSEFTISLFGMLFFTGYAIGNLIIPVLSDHYGRKKIFVCNMLVRLFSFISLLLLPNDYNCIYIIMAIFFIGGFNSAGRMMVGYCYMIEMAPTKDRSWMCTVWDIHDGTMMIWVTIYYVYVSKNWRPTLYWASIVQSVTIILISCFLPESPKWLYNQRDLAKSHKVFTYMAK